jgi:chromosomal replication initiator protein
MELTAAELWSRIQEVVRDSLPEHAFHTWIASAAAVAFTSDELVLEAQYPFHVEWLEDKYGPLLSSAAQRVLGRPLAIRVTSASKPTPPSPPTLELDAAPSGPASNPLPQASPGHVASNSRPRLNERYTFERFVVGSNNELAAAASRAVSDQLARIYNPLFLYGGVGLGKTHLMHAIGHHVLTADSTTRVAYLSCEQFTNELVSSIRNGTTQAFRTRYREIDLLLVDDVQFLQGKEGTQEEFFYTFNALYDAQRQIVLTSDRPPQELPRLPERLVSRFEWGLVVDMRPPDFETRVAILRKKAEDDGLTIDSAVLDFIAQSCTASVRELEGAVIKLLAYSSLTNQDITPSLAQTALRYAMRRAHQDGPVQSPERIRKLVARRWRVREDALESKRRTRDVTVPRQVAMYLIKDLLGTPLSRIGELFGGRDHTTVIHSIRKVHDEMERDPDFKRLVDAARRELQEHSDTSDD